MHAYVQPMLQSSRHSAPLMPYMASQSMRDSGKANPLDDVVALGRVRIVAEGTAIHRAGDAFRSVFYVKSGAAKRVLIQEDGREQILGFPMPGDIVAMEAISAGTHSTTVIALDICAIVEIPFEALETLAAERPDAARFIYQRTSAALREEHSWLAALGLLNADERLATFLLDLSQRFSARGFSAQRFMLRMTSPRSAAFLA